MEGAEVVVYFEVTAVITVLVLLGQLLPASAIDRTVVALASSAATASERRNLADVDARPEMTYPGNEFMFA